jgi:hypothetical protein
LACGLAFQACGPKVNFLKQAPDFNYAALAGGQIVVCGVTTTAVSGDSAYSLREPFTQILEARLLKKRPDLHFLPTKSLYSLLGQDRYDSILDGFENAGQVSQTELASCDSLIGEGARYAVLSRIEREELNYDLSSTTDEKTDNETRTWTTKLEIRVAFQVYDLRSARSVWSASLSGKSAKKNTYEERDLLKGNVLANVVTEVVAGSLGIRGQDDYPPPPTEIEILSEIFDEFAVKLPRPPK